MQIHSPHGCALIPLGRPHQGKARHGWHGMAWHDLVGCACALSYDVSC